MLVACDAGSPTGIVWQASMATRAHESPPRRRGLLCGAVIFGTIAPVAIVLLRYVPGKPDLIAANGGNDTLTNLTNNGAGTVGPNAVSTWAGAA